MFEMKRTKDKLNFVYNVSMIHILPYKKKFMLRNILSRAYIINSGNRGDSFDIWYPANGIRRPEEQDDDRV
jgi:hypothetical protein